MSERRAAALAALLPAIVLAGLWALFDVPVSDVALFVGYQVALVGVPGVLLYRALSRRPGGVLRHVAVGWPLGYAVEVAAFVLTAGLDARALFPLVPAAVAVGSALWLWRRSRRGGAEASAGERPEARLPPAAIWIAAGAISLALVYLAVGYFTVTPLPGSVDSVAYDVDNVWDIELVAEAKNHWPMRNPSVIDTDLRYYVYAFVDMAAVSQVTGIEPATILFRLFPAALIVLVGLQLIALGRELGRSAWVGPLALVLVLCVGELDLDPERPAPFGDTFFQSLPLSPTFLFAVSLFLAAVTLLVAALRDRNESRAGGWAMVGALFLLCGGAKAMTLPVLLGGLSLWIGWARWRGRDAAPGLIALAVAALAAATTYAAFFSGADGGFMIELFAFAESTVIGEELAPASPLGDALLTVATGVVAGAALLLPVLGIVWVLRQPAGLEPGQALLLGLLLAGVLGFSVTTVAGDGQAYFLQYGYIAGCLLSAQGIAAFLERHGPGWEWRRAVAVALAAGGIAAAVIYVPGVEISGLGRFAAGYAVAALVVAALALWARRSSGGTIPVAGAALLLAIALGLLNTPLDDGFPYAQAVESEPRRYVHAPDDPDANKGLTAELYEGLRWVRENSGTDALIAVNHHARDATGHDSRYFYYTAFSERRALLESWLHTSEARERGYEEVLMGEVDPPFQDLRELNAAGFDGDRDALATMTDDYGVDLLLVDKVHGEASVDLREALGAPIFENPALAVYALSA